MRRDALPDAEAPPEPPLIEASAPAEAEAPSPAAGEVAKTLEQIHLDVELLPSRSGDVDAATEAMAEELSDEEDVLAAPVLTGPADAELENWDKPPAEAEPPAEEKPPVEDPLRRLALIVTAVAVPVVIALVVLVNVLGSGNQEQGSGSGRSFAKTSRRIHSSAPASGSTR